MRPIPGHGEVRLTRAQILTDVMLYDPNTFQSETDGEAEPAQDQKSESG